MTSSWTSPLASGSLRGKAGSGKSGGAPRCARVLVLVLAALAGCGGVPDAPQDVVALYFRSLGRDPVRSAALVTPEFHARHGLRIQSAWTDTASAEQPFRLSSAELAWLGVQRRPEYFAYAPRLQVGVGDVQSGDALHAVVTTRVAGPGAPAFTQRFFLLRAAPDASWRIDRIEQQDLVPANRTAAFVASPSRAEGRTPARDGD